MSPIDTLIESLVAAQTAPDAYNEYAGNDANNVIRCENLRCYLNAMMQQTPQLMLVMEAPGYRGCRLTGVPVTSRKILLEGVPELAFFGAAHGYQNTADVGFEAIYGEQSATIVWQTLADLRVVPIIWNTVPFHPHHLGKPLTNRAPRKLEIEHGSDFLQQVIQLFQPQKIIAVGNVAYGALMALNISCHKIRHPAQGGKHEFVTGLKAAIGKNSG
jgi:uracil-DNA glycosylase